MALESNVINPASGDIYKYNIEIKVLLNDGAEIVTLREETIHYMYIEYEYDKYNMPIVFLSLALDKNLCDKMVTFANNSLVNLTVYKYVSNSDMPGIKTVYIQDQFMYFIGKDFNQNKAQDYEYINKNRDDIYAITTVGLMKKDLVNKNKKKFGGVLTNTSLTSAIYFCCGDLPLLMEPIKYNNNISQIIFPSLSSVSQAISFLNRNVHAFYDTSYRFFMDFGITYLLSSSGNPVPVKGEKITSIIMTVHKSNNQASTVQGMKTDAKQLTYSIDLNENDVYVYQDRSTERTFNQLSVVSSGSVLGNASLNLGKSNYVQGKEEIIRVPNNNTTLLANRQAELESSILTMEISKVDIDSSVFTPNKVFSLKATEVYPNRDGKYLMKKKKEVYLREGNHMNLNTIMTFNKIG